MKDFLIYTVNKQCRRLGIDKEEGEAGRANHTGCETPKDVAVTNTQPEDAASSSLLVSEMCSFQRVQGLE